MSSRVLGDPAPSAVDLRLMVSAALRAPMLSAVTAIITVDHPSVRVIDQQLSAGAAAMNLLNAAHLLGCGGTWLTGESCHDPMVKQALGLRRQDFDAGWLYLGTPTEQPPEPARPAPDAFLREWSGPA